MSTNIDPNDPQQVIVIGQSLLDLSARLPDSVDEDGPKLVHGANRLNVEFDAFADEWVVNFHPPEAVQPDVRRGADLASLLLGILQADRIARPEV